MNSWKTKNNRQKAVAAADAAARTVSGTAALVLRILLTVLLGVHFLHKYRAPGSEVA